MIASYRLNAVQQAHLANCAYDVSGFEPVYSTSFYTVIAMAILAIIGSLIVTLVSTDDYDYQVQGRRGQVDAGRRDGRSGQPSSWSDWNPLKQGVKPSFNKLKNTSRTTKQVGCNSLFELTNVRKTASPICFVCRVNYLS